MNPPPAEPSSDPKFSPLAAQRHRTSAAAAPRAKSRWAGRLATCGASLVASALLAEVLVLLVLGEQPKFPRHVVTAPWGVRYNEPGARYRHKSADMTTYFRINHQGMRSDRDVAYDKPPGVQRIVSLGDSFTIGYEVDVEQCFSSVLENALTHAGIDVEVLNAGVSGFSTAEALVYLERELIKYAPDLVLVSFYGNDFADNERSELFRLEAGRLIEQNTTYVPGGWVADLLNTNGPLNLLAEHSNAFAIAREGLTTSTKRRMDVQRERQYAETQPPAAEPVDPAAALTAAIFERMYDFLHARGIPLVIQSIPTPRWDGSNHTLAELFPLALFDVHRPGLYFASAKAFLPPDADVSMLYRTHSQGHWTPHSHATSGQRLAELIMREQLLR